MAALHKRATVYFDPDLHRALRLKAAETDTSVSELGNEAVKGTLAEDADDLAAFEERDHEPDLPFEDMPGVGAQTVRPIRLESLIGETQNATKHHIRS